MFLHALLFFLLGPSVFAAPVGSHVDTEQFIDVWYPVVPCNSGFGTLMQILPDGVIKRLQQERDGTISEKPPTDYHPITTVWRRFPQKSTSVDSLPDLLSTKDEDGDVTFSHARRSDLLTQNESWATDNSYWYQIPDPHYPKFESSRVLRFEGESLTGIGSLGDNGGFDSIERLTPGSVVPEGTYIRLPFPGSTLHLLLERMQVTHGKNRKGKFTFKIDVFRGKAE